MQFNVELKFRYSLVFYAALFKLQGLNISVLLKLQRYFNVAHGLALRRRLGLETEAWIRDGALYYSVVFIFLADFFL